jgi:hypothetical protein
MRIGRMAECACLGGGRGGRQGRATHRVQVEGAGDSYAVWSDQSLIDRSRLHPHRRRRSADRDDTGAARRTGVPRRAVGRRARGVVHLQGSRDGVVVVTGDAVDATRSRNCTWRPCARGSTTTRSSTGCRSWDCCCSSPASPSPWSRRSDGGRASETRRWPRRRQVGGVWGGVIVGGVAGCRAGGVRWSRRALWRPSRDPARGRWCRCGRVGSGGRGVRSTRRPRARSSRSARRSGS